MFTLSFSTSTDAKTTWGRFGGRGAGVQGGKIILAESKTHSLSSSLLHARRQFATRTADNMCLHIVLDGDQSVQLSVVAGPGLKCKCRRISSWASTKTEALSSSAYPHEGVLEAYCSEVHVHSHSPRLADHVHKQRFMEHPVRMCKQSIHCGCCIAGAGRCACL